MALEEKHDRRSLKESEGEREKSRYRSGVHLLKLETQALYQRAVGVHTLSLRHFESQGERCGEIEWALDTLRGLVSDLHREVVKAHKRGEI